MSDLSFHVRQFVPAADGEEMEHRQALLRARDYAAMMRGQTVSNAAYDLAWRAHEAAGEFVFASDVPLPRLKAAVSYCRHLVQAAMLAERMEADHG